MTSAISPVRLAEILLLVGLVWFTASRFLAGNDAPAAIRLTSDNRSGTPTGSTIPDPAILARFDPFNRTISQPALNETPSDIAQETSLDLVLLGVRQTVGNSDRGSAIIRLPNKDERAFATGDDIVRGARLLAVHATYVEISHRGSREILSFPGQTPNRARVSAPARASSVTAPGTRAQRGGSPVQSTRSGRLTADDIRNFSQNARLTPRYVGTRLDGWTIEGAQTPSALAALTLEPDDILLSVNGAKLSRAETLTELVEEIGNARSLVLEIERDSKRYELTFEYQAG